MTAGEEDRLWLVMEMQQARYFPALCEEKHVTPAATRCGRGAEESKFQWITESLLQHRYR
jgi:hypothetical protein